MADTNVVGIVFVVICMLFLIAIVIVSSISMAKAYSAAKKCKDKSTKRAFIFSYIVPTIASAVFIILLFGLAFYVYLYRKELGFKGREKAVSLKAMAAAKPPREQKSNVRDIEPPRLVKNKPRPPPQERPKDVEPLAGMKIGAPMWNPPPFVP